MLRIKTFLLALLIVFAPMGAHTFAQESTPEAAITPVVEVVDDANDTTLEDVQADAPDELAAALQLIVKMVSDITFVPGAAALVIALTAILKRYIPTNPGNIALVLQVIAWVAFILAKHFGYEPQFQNWMDSLTTIVTGVGGLVLSSMLATKGYISLKRNDVPILGEQDNAQRQQLRAEVAEPH